MRLAILITLSSVMLAFSASAAERSRAVRAEFVRSTPCPATGKTHGACPNHQVDHRTPLCLGGRDEPANLQWLTVEAHKAKTRDDVRLCRRGWM